MKNTQKHKPIIKPTFYIIMKRKFEEIENNENNEEIIDNYEPINDYSI